MKGCHQQKAKKTRSRKLGRPVFIGPQRHRIIFGPRHISLIVRLLARVSVGPAGRNGALRGSV